MVRQRRIPRCHVDTPLRVGDELMLERSVSHHLLTVLRASAGDTLELFNGDGHDYAAELIETGKRASVIIHATTINGANSPLHSTLLQGISRGEKMDVTIQKCVELGLSRLCPVYTRRSITPLDEKRTAKKLEHWRSVAISACEQSGRSRVPVIDAPTSLAAWLSEFDICTGLTREQPDFNDPQPLACVLSPDSVISLSTVCREYRGASAIQLVGPESGLDADEVGAAVERGFTAVRLGPRILRTETAGLAAMTLLQAFCGDLDDARSD